MSFDYIDMLNSIEDRRKWYKTPPQSSYATPDENKSDRCKELERELEELKNQESIRQAYIELGEECYPGEADGKDGTWAAL